MATILLCEDHEVVREALKEIIENEQHQVILANDGEEGLALAIANKDRINLIVTDRDMPGLNGDQMLHQIRLAGIDIPAILQTVIPGLDEKRKGFQEIGFSEVLSKWDIVEKLIPAIERILTAEECW